MISERFKMYTGESAQLDLSSLHKARHAYTISMCQVADAVHIRIGVFECGVVMQVAFRIVKQDFNISRVESRGQQDFIYEACWDRMPV